MYFLTGNDLELGKFPKSRRVAMSCEFERGLRGACCQFEGTTEFRKELVVGCLVGNEGMSFEHGKTTGS